MSAATVVASHRIAAREFPAPDQLVSRSAKEQFSGTWKLVSWKIEQANGELLDPPLGPDPLGWIMYQPGGHMSVVLMRSDRPKFASNNLIEATPEEVEPPFKDTLATAAPTRSTNRSVSSFTASN